MATHAIHLGNAWERRPGTGHAAEHVWRRRFGGPTGLGAGDRVLLVVERPAMASTPALNGRGLAPIAAGTPRWSCDVTALLDVRNELVLVAAVHPDAAPTPPAGAADARGPLPAPLGGVRLEIVPRGAVVDPAPAPSATSPPPRHA